MSATTSLAELRRIKEALQHFKGGQVADAVLRPDARLLKVSLEDGSLVLISAGIDAKGRPRLDIDVVRGVEEPSRRQLEVHFD